MTLMATASPGLDAPMPIFTKSLLLRIGRKFTSPGVSVCVCVRVCARVCVCSRIERTSGDDDDDDADDDDDDDV